MKKNKEQCNVPALRFPEFWGSGAWEEIKLGEISDITTGSSNREDSSLDAQYTFFDRSEDIRKSSRYLFDCEAVIIAGEGQSFSPKYFIGKFDLHQRTYAVMNFENVQGKFIYYFIDKNSNYFLQQAVGSTVKSLRLPMFQSMPVLSPSVKEQKKIANCLSSLDEWITAESKQLTALKTHKTGLMQQLFPSEGETTPKLRFPEFRGSGEWVNYQLGDKLDVLSGYPFKSNEISEVSTGTPILRGINVTEGYIRHNEDIDKFFLGICEPLEKYLLVENDLVIGMDGSKVGKNSALVDKKDEGALLIQRVARLRSNCLHTIQFVFQHIHSNIFHSYVDRINTSGGIPHISAKQINEFSIGFPSSSQEQQKIADCLSSLDTLITAQAEKIEQLKQHKKGLMQQLFPTLDGVGA